MPLPAAKPILASARATAIDQNTDAVHNEGQGRVTLWRRLFLTEFQEGVRQNRAAVRLPPISGPPA